MLKKIDMTKVKDFLLKHGEKVGLGVCASIALFLGLWGFVRAWSAGTPEQSNLSWSQTFKKKGEEIEKKTKEGAGQKPPTPAEAAEEARRLSDITYKWSVVDSKYDPVDYVPPGGIEAAG